jgi:hypothetical protein
MLAQSPLVSTPFANLAIDETLEGVPKLIPPVQIKFSPIHYFSRTDSPEAQQTCFDRVSHPAKHRCFEFG